MSNTINKSNLAYGLNSRANQSTKKSTQRKKGLAGFGVDESDDSDGGANNDRGGGISSSGRGGINREIAAEQAALRKRAEAAMAASSTNGDSAVYDYDGEYDSFATGGDAAKKEMTATNSKENEKMKGQSRYISSLLKTAKRRNQEQEIIYERKIAREQAEEDAEMEYEGKEKFITSSYKRKLEEREQWAKEEEERERREKEEDVTKTKKGGNFLFGGFSRNVVMGAIEDKGEEKHTSNDDRDSRGSNQREWDKEGSHDHFKEDDHRRDSSRETERRGSSKRSRDSRQNDSNHERAPSLDENNGNASSTNDGTETKEVRSRSQILAERAIKIRDARERYFKRRGIVPNQ